MSTAKAPWQGPLCSDRIALVTGGAGAIGAATCRALADHGADVVVADRAGDRVAQVVAEVEARGRRALGVTTDLVEPGAIEALVARANEAFGRIDILVNALGEHLALSAPFERSDEQGWDRLYRVNLLATMQATHAVVPGMRARRWGRIVNFSSVEGIRAMPNASPYTAFKGAIDSFTKSLGVELAGDGIRVNAIAPGWVATPGTIAGGRIDEAVKAVPLGRAAAPEEIADWVWNLARNPGGYLTGETVVVSGGLVMR